MSIVIRAIGHAGRRGATRRVPSAEAVLDLVDEWLAESAADTARGHVAGVRAPDGALEVRFHPAARPVRFGATDAGRVAVEAETVPVGPGYHTFVASLLRRLGDDLDIEWAGPPDLGRPDQGAALAGAPSARTSVLSRATGLPGAALSRAGGLPGAVLSRATAGGSDEDDEPSTDPTGAFFSGSRAEAERGHLAWLRASLLAVRDARRIGVAGLHLGTQPGVRYTFDAAVATVLGPRDDAWLERALGDPRVAADVWPWVADAMDARYHLNRALTFMWIEVRWRPPVGDAETVALDDLLASLRHAYPLEPGLPWPWAEWREAFVLRGLSDPATFQLLQRANTPRGPRGPEPTPGAVLVGVPEATVAANGTNPAAAHDDDDGDGNGRIGYRRRPVTILHEGWALDLPGSFSEERTPEEWSGSDAGRTVTLAATETAVGDAPMSAEVFLREFASGLGRDVIEHDAGGVRGRARLSSDSATGVEVATVEGYSAVRGSGAVIRIVIEDPGDWKWALDTWRGLRPA
ncbi:MAG TPA: hypothetical protein VIK65_03915 [Candidatus Limnocylindrales bacterium]